MYSEFRGLQLAPDPLTPKRQRQPAKQIEFEFDAVIQFPFPVSWITARAMDVNNLSNPFVGIF